MSNFLVKNVRKDEFVKKTKGVMGEYTFFLNTSNPILLDHAEICYFSNYEEAVDAINIVHKTESVELTILEVFRQ